MTDKLGWLLLFMFAPDIDTCQLTLAKGMLSTVWHPDSEGGGPSLISSCKLSHCLEISTC